MASPWPIDPAAGRRRQAGDPSWPRLELAPLRRAAARAAARIGVPTLVFFSLVALAAGISAVLLLGWPGSSGRTFSWALRPEPAAALIGGCYLVSTFVFGLGCARPWTEVRAICVAVYGLVLPTMVETFLHLHVFDFSRWQALLWVALFVAAPPAITYVHWSQRATPIAPGAPLVGWTRAVLIGSAAVFAVAAIALLVAPTRDAISDHAPFALVGLTGSYLGAWCSFAAVLCGWTAWRNSRTEARLALPTLAAVAAGGVVAALRTLDDIAQAGTYLSVLAGLVVLYAACWAVNARRTAG
jgi:hypothetical protein